MTVSVITPRIRYKYTGPGNYVFNFPVYNETDLLLVYTSPAGETTRIRYGEAYTVVLMPEGDGYCVLTYDKSDGFLEIRRKLAIEQRTDYVNNDPFDMDILETDLDTIVMTLQDHQVYIDLGDADTNWRGDWTEETIYDTHDMVRDPKKSIYVCIHTHTSSIDFSADLAQGYWQLVVDIGEMQGILEDTEAAAEAAELSETNALASSNSAGVSEQNALVYKGQAQQSADLAQQSAAQAEMARDQAVPAAVAAEHWAQYPEDQEVPESQNPPEFSAYHWMKKAQQIAGGGVTSISGTGAIVIDNTDPQSPIIGVPAIPSGGLTGQVLAKATDFDFATEWKDADHDAYTVKFTAAGDAYFLESHIATPEEVEQGLINDKLLTPANAANALLARGVPTSAVMAFAGDIASDKWLLCDGQEVPKSIYNDLYLIIQDTFGAPANSDNFVLPDLQDQFVRGSSATRTVGSTQDSANKEHSHHVNSVSGSVYGSGTHGHSVRYGYSSTYSAGAQLGTTSADTGDYDVVGNGAHTHTCAIGAHDTDPDGESESRPVNMALMYFIKT